MSLTIKETNGIFNLEGSINAATAKYFQTHFETILNASKKLTINIDNIIEIDINGMKALKRLHTNALIFNRYFYIVGNGCKEIYDEFRFNSVA